MEEMSPIRAFFHNRWVITILIIDVLAIAAVIFIAILNNTKTATLDILVTPADSTIKINGEEYKNGTYSLHPSEITAVISHENLETKEFTLTLEQNQTTKLYAYLTGENNSLDYYITHPTDLGLLYNFPNDPTVQSFLNNYTKITSLTQYLPLEKTEFDTNNTITSSVRITKDPTENCPTYLCLKVSLLYTTNQEIAKNLIREKGYNPENYQLTFVTY